MTRPKSMPPIHKPAFDEESALMFAGREVDQVSGDVTQAPGNDQAGGLIDRKEARNGGADRLPVTLMLKSEVIARLKEEAGRKEKAIDQIVEKLVVKHLGKH